MSRSSPRAIRWWQVPQPSGHAVQRRAQLVGEFGKKIVLRVIGAPDVILRTLGTLLGVSQRRLGTANPQMGAYRSHQNLGRHLLDQERIGASARAARVLVRRHSSA